MCRHTIYFKGLYKISEKWEDERIEKLNEEAFNTAFDAIFEEESDSDYSDYEDSDSDSDWETSSESESETDDWNNESSIHGLFNDVWEAFQEVDDSSSSEISSEETISQVESDSDYWIKSIVKLQAAYQKALKLYIDIPRYLDSENYLFVNINQFEGMDEDEYDDVFPHEKNLFVSKHSGMIQNKRTGSRVPPKGDNSYTLVLLVEC